jgi:hypothetical protein
MNLTVGRLEYLEESASIAFLQGKEKRKHNLELV